MASSLRLYARPACPYCRRIEVYSREARVEGLERIAYDPDRDRGTLRALNPRLTVPTLDTGTGLVLYESFVIMEYLEELGGGELTPATPAERARMRLLYSVADLRLGDSVRLFSRAPLDDPARVGHAETLAERSAEALPFLDPVGPFALSTFSLADLSVPPLVFRAAEAGFHVRTLPPRIQQWCAAVAARPAVLASFPKAAQTFAV